MNRQGIAWLSALDIERSRLRIDEGVFADLAEQVSRRAHLPAEAVLRVQIQDLARLDAGHRIDAPKRPGVLLFGRDDPLDVDGLDHSPAFVAARLSART